MCDDFGGFERWLPRVTGPKRALAESNSTPKRAKMNDDQTTIEPAYQQTTEVI